MLDSRMRRTLFIVGICLSSATTLRAQDFLSHVTVSAGAGFTFPVDSLANQAKNGFNFVASGGPRFTPRFSTTLDFGLHYMDVKNSFKSAETNVELSMGSLVRIWSLTVNPSYAFIKREQFSTYAT